MTVDPIAPTSPEPNPNCVWCGGTGIGGEVDRGMALDAGDPSMEGQPIPCACVPPAPRTYDVEVPF